jgi:hypothetical protein
MEQMHYHPDLSKETISLFGNGCREIPIIKIFYKRGKIPNLWLVMKLKLKYEKITFVCG